MEVWWHMPLLAARGAATQGGNDIEQFPFTSEESFCHKITNSEEQTHHLEGGTSVIQMEMGWQKPLLSVNDQ